VIESADITNLSTALHQRPPEPRTQVIDIQQARITRRKILGGLINEYSQVA
jgi:putative transposase